MLKTRTGYTIFIGVFFLCLLAEIAFFLHYPDMYPIRSYYLACLLKMTAALALAGLAFLCCRVGREKTFHVLLVLSAIAAFFCVSDSYIVLFRRDTSGPGNEKCLTHVLWREKRTFSNTLGFWERDVKAFMRPTNRIVIAVVGDSFTWGQGVKYQQRFTFLLENLLGKDFDGRITLLNFGRPGLSPPGELEVIQGPARSVSPKIIMICYLSNDIVPKELHAVPKGYEMIDRIGGVLRFSPTLNFLFWRTLAPTCYKKFTAAYYANIRAAYEDDVLLHEHLLEVKAMLDASRAMGAKPIFVILPFPQLSVMTGWENIQDTYKKIGTYVQDLGVPVLDLSYLEKSIPLKKFVLNSMDAHPNPYAHARIAEGLYKKGKPILEKLLRENAW